MPKTFYTEHDVMDMANRGVTTLEVGDDVVLTDLARDLALKRGLQLVKRGAAGAQPVAQGADAQAELVRRVKAAVIARLGGQVDMQLLDTVIARVIKGM